DDGQVASVKVATALGAPLAQLAAAVAQCVAACAVCAQMARMAGPSSAVDPTGIQGQILHTMIQEHYLMSHPGHTVMTESFVNMLNFRGSIKAIGMMSTTANPLLGALRFALGSIKEYTKLPDILDYTSGEVYDIKPRSQMASGRLKVCRTD